MTYHGFKSANNAGQPAWFHTAAAALRFANACGFTTGEDQRWLTLSDIETTDDPDPSDIMDTPICAWTSEATPTIAKAEGAK